MSKDSGRDFSDLIPDHARDKPTIRRRIGEGIKIRHQAGDAEGYERGRIEGLKEGDAEGYLRGIKKGYSMERTVKVLGTSLIGGVFGLLITLFFFGTNDPFQLITGAGIGCMCGGAAANYIM